MTTQAQPAVAGGKPDYVALQFPPAPADRPYVVLNMIASVDGKTVVEGTERGLGSATDQRLMRELRVHADVVLNGAGTLRASGTSSRLGDEALEDVREARGKTRAPYAAVLSRSGDLPLGRAFFTARDFEAVVYLSDTAPEERRHAVRATGRTVVELPAGAEIPAMLRHMRHELGAGLLLLEGGPTMNGELFEIGAIDEYFQTIGPVVVGGRNLPTSVEAPWSRTRESLIRLQLVSAVPNPETSEVYLHYRVVQR